MLISTQAGVPFGNEALVVERELVDALNLLSVHFRCEFQDRYTFVRVLELVQ